MSNPITLIGSFAPTVVTSLTDQQKTSVITSDNLIQNSDSSDGNLLSLVSCLIYAPSAKGSKSSYNPVICYATMQEPPDTSPSEIPVHTNSQDDAIEPNNQDDVVIEPSSPSKTNNPTILANRVLDGIYKFEEFVESSSKTNNPTILTDRVLDGTYKFEELAESLTSPSSINPGSPIKTPSSSVPTNSSNSPSLLSQSSTSSSSSSSSSSLEEERNYYTKIIDVKFGKGFRLCVFWAIIDKPLDKNTTITVEHPPSMRRVMIVDEFSGVKKNPVDQRIFTTSMNQLISDISVETSKTKSKYELVYGVVSLGDSFDRYDGPIGYSSINSGGTNVDQFDANLYTYYKLTDIEGTQSLTGFVSGSEAYWAAAITSFLGI
jgi:hypothetical protein